MRFICLSDTHGRHSEVTVPDGDVLICAGDFTESGHPGEVDLFLAWLATLPHERKILVAGNHEFWVEEHTNRFRQQVGSIPNLYYLQDSGAVIDGVKYWGSPVTPRYFDWAFNRDRGADIRRHWALIPTATQVLVTHAPPFGIGDTNRDGSNEGCRDLLEAVCSLPDLRLHVFGHIHPGCGVFSRSHCVYVNACVLDARNCATNGCQVVDVSLGADEGEQPFYERTTS